MNDDTENTESEDEDFCTDDSDDNYGGRHRKKLRISTQQNSSSSSSSSSLSSPNSLSSLSPHSDKYHQHQTHSHHHNTAYAIKRKKIESIPVDLDNEDACSEDAFIRKVASSINMTTLDSAQQSIQVQVQNQQQMLQQAVRLVPPPPTK